jgi:hypothetical protein
MLSRSSLAGSGRWFAVVLTICGTVGAVLVAGDVLGIAACVVLIGFMAVAIPDMSRVKVV